MIDTILVPTSGMPSDATVFGIAYAIAEPLNAHMKFYHFKFSATEAAVRTPHMGFCLGNAATANAFQYLEDREKHFSEAAHEHFQRFCHAHHIEVRLPSPLASRVSAEYLQETRQPEERILAQARLSDLTILSREGVADLMPDDLIERLIISSGRPVILATATQPRPRIDNIVVGWNETPEAARSLSAALPILKRARRVFLVTVSTYPERAALALQDVARELAHHRVRAEAHVIIGNPKDARAHLRNDVQMRRADLLVVGAYGRRPWREALFGGVTAAVIEEAACATFLMH